MSKSTPRDGQSRTAFARMALMTALLTSCGEEATVPFVPPVEQLVTVQVTMDVPSFPGLNPSAAHVVFTRSNGDVALDTLRAEDVPLKSRRRDVVMVDI